MTAASLAVSGVRVAYGDLVVVRDATFVAPPGKLTVVSAPNGSGKTTLFNGLAGLQHRTGVVRVGDADVVASSPHASLAEGLALVPENRQIFTDLSVDENIWLGAYALLRSRSVRAAHRRDVDARREAILDLFPVLGERTRQAAGTLSGGEQQMLAIARALMSLPRVLLLDEPTLGLAPLAMSSLRDEIVKLTELGLTVVVAEQNSKVFVGHIDEVVRFHDGVVRADDDATVE